MSFDDEIKAFESFDFKNYLRSVTDMDIEKSLEKDSPDRYDLLNFLSKRARNFLERMAVKARSITRQYFGRTIGLYAPLYISNYCSNHCSYCGFNTGIHFRRTKLSLEEIEQEAKTVADTGIRHILILTGESPSKTPLSYLEAAVLIMKKYFSSIAIEIFPMEEKDYAVLVKAGADSLTIYQEVYDRKIYKEVHLKGKKSDYLYRLTTPERGARANFRGVNIGTLFGLGEPRSEAFFACIHAKYLEREYPDVEISLSLPRMTKAKGGIEPRNRLSDIDFVQFMLAWRLFMPRLGITVSSREAPAFRDRLIHLGATRYSAGSKTDVGGYSINTNPSTVQFEVSDTRNVEEISQMIKRSGYQPVFKDWEIF